MKSNDFEERHLGTVECDDEVVVVCSGCYEKLTIHCSRNVGGKREAWLQRKLPRMHRNVCHAGICRFDVRFPHQ